MITTKMKKLVFGEIVLLKFPFSDGKNYKKRPALLLRDTIDGDIIVCRITSKLNDTEFDFKIKNWAKCGLKLPSIIRLHKIASLEKDIVEQIIGTIGERMKHNLKEKFTSLLS